MTHRYPVNALTKDELLAALALAEKEEEAAEKAAAQTEEWRRLAANPAAWEWKSCPRKYDRWGQGIIDGVRVAVRMKPTPHKAWAENGPATFSTSFQDGSWQGMFYHRTDEGILAREGCGTLVLKEPKLCSDEEWAAILAGDIPDKFKRELS